MSTRSDHSSRRPLARAVTAVLAAVACMAVGGDPGFAQIEVQFPGPEILDLGAEVTSAVALEGLGEPGEYLAVGSGNGAIALVRYRRSVGQFSILNRYFTRGAVTHLVLWRGLPAGQVGLVAGTADADAVVFLTVSLTQPNFQEVATVDLEEDPGVLAFAVPAPAAEPVLAVSLPGVDEIVIVREAESGWSAVQTMAAGDQPRDLAVFDSDGDGSDEIYASERGYLSGGVGVFTVDAGGDYVRTRVFEPSVPLGALVAFDVDGDGDQELAAAARDESLVVFLEVTPAGLVESQSADLLLAADSIALESWADGSPGLFTANRERGLVEFSRRSEGVWSLAESYFPGCRPIGLLGEDFNGDGLPDLVALGGDTGLMTVMFGNPDPGLWGFPALTLAGDPVATLIDDFDGDDLGDVLVSSVGLASLSLFPGTSEGGVAPRPLEYAVAFYPGALAVLDLGGPDRTEVAVGDPGGRAVAVMRLLDDGVVQTLSRTVVDGQVVQILAADVDGDGAGDLVLRFQTGLYVRVLWGDGQGSFPAFTELLFPFGAHGLGCVDLDADGLLEVMTTDGTNRLWFRPNLTGRAFGNNLVVNTGDGPRDIAVGDIDGDGDQDVIVSNFDEPSLTMLENDGSGSPVRRIGSHALTAPAEGLALTDVDLDGRDDILVNLRESGEIGMVLVGALWDFSVTLTYRGGGDVAVFAPADLNFDGVPDILALDQTLQLGLAMLNVDRSLVAVDPAALAAECLDEGLRLRIRPDRSGPWDLSLAAGDRRQLLAVAGWSAAGDLVFDRDVWLLDFGREEWAGLLAGWDPGATFLSLTVGEGEGAESLDVAVEDLCLKSDPVPAGRDLAWAGSPWPNPFNPSVRARYVLARGGQVRAGVFDLRGRLVALLHDGALPSGVHEVHWDGSSGTGPAAGGVYLLRISTPGTVIAAKLLLAK
ncbi:MAG: FG-GAP-like repeat-containing protein [Candidatus Krumholzibacteriia bacterium]